MWNPRIREEPKPLWLGRGTRGRPTGCGAGAAPTLQDARPTRPGLLGSFSSPDLPQFRESRHFTFQTNCFVFKALCWDIIHLP